MVGTKEAETEPAAKPLVGVIMGSKSDWETMRWAHEMLDRFGVTHECRIVSAHRTPQLLADYAGDAEARGLQVLIAGAGGAAHLPGMAAAFSLLPVLGVPVESHALKGMDSLLSIAQMPGGIPVGTLAIGKAGATNAALLAVAILAGSRPELREALRAFRQEQTEGVLGDSGSLPPRPPSLPVVPPSWEGGEVGSTREVGPLSRVASPPSREGGTTGREGGRGGRDPRERSPETSPS